MNDEWKRPTTVDEISGDWAPLELGHFVELRLRSIEAIPASDGTFHLVFSRDIMGHVAALSTIYRLLGKLEERVYPLRRM
jgi:hypothetical protein